MRLVIVESPYAGDIDRNTEYARAALADCLARSEAPYASHLLYTQPGVLNDTDPLERRLGILAGLAWGDRADATVVYTDHGITPGMEQGIERAHAAGRPVEYRLLPIIWGRVLVRGRWRPAYKRAAIDALHVSPAIDLAWRHATPAERATWQRRRDEHQHTTGGIQDDALYITKEETP